MSAEESEAQKVSWLRKQLAPWADRLERIRTVDEPGRWGYRDKVCLSTAYIEGGWKFGLRVRDELLPIPCCPVHSERVRSMVQLLTDVLPPGDAFPMVYYVQAGAQATLVLKTDRLPDTSWLDGETSDRLQRTGIEGLWLHLNPSTGKRVLAKRDWHLIRGSSRSTDEHGLLYGPASFQQLLPALYAHAIAEAETFLAPAREENVIDLYCGTGSTLVRWASRGARTIGVELGGEAVACAQLNAPGALVLRGTCAHRIPQLNDWLGAAAGAGNRTLLYANPPRTGLEAAILDWIVSTCRPARMAYLSCSTGTLRRDVDVLTRSGYDVARLTPYDFFPQTYHVETLALLQMRG